MGWVRRGVRSRITVDAASRADAEELIRSLRAAMDDAGSAADGGFWFELELKRAEG